MMTIGHSRLAEAPVGPVLRVADYDRAKRFWEDKIGLEVEDVPGMPGNGMVKVGHGTQMLLYESPLAPPRNTVAGFIVDDVDGTVAELRGRGVLFEEYDMPGLKTEGGIARNGSMKSAWFKDSEDNIIAISTM